MNSVFVAFKTAPELLFLLPFAFTATLVPIAPPTIPLPAQMALLPATAPPALPETAEPVPLANKEETP